MPDYSRRSIILGTAGIAAAGAGVTAAASGLSGSVEGQADVQAEQALTVTEVSIPGRNDQDASFTRVSDDNTEFQAAVELNNGDDVVFEVGVENSAADKVSVEVAVDSPDPIDVDVRNPSSTSPDNTDLSSSGSSSGDGELDPDDDGTTSEAVQTGEGTFVAKIDGNASGSSGSGSSEFIDIAAELDDTADPGSYDIGVAINPLSTDAT